MSELVDFKRLLAHIGLQRDANPPNKRLLVAIVGAPGSGKSTLAEKVVDALNDVRLHSAENPSRAACSVVIPMDGFHLDNGILESRGHLPKKGAPHTFDVAGFASLLQRLAQPCVAGDDHSPPFQSSENLVDDAVYVPLFDRTQDLSRNAAQAVDARHSVLVIEGNYLLLNRPDWQVLHTLFDITVMLRVPVAELENRLIQRWRDHGLSEDAARRRALGNDIPNAHVVIDESSPAGLEFHSV